MLHKLKMELKGNNINLKKSVNLHGIIFENISHDYGEVLHKSKMHPYSQNLKKENGKWFWEINTLNDKAADEILPVFLSEKFNTVIFKEEQNNPVEIISKNYKKINLNTPIEKDQIKNIININIYTPLIFKKKGKFINLPDLEHIYQNLLNRYNYNLENENEDNGIYLHDYLNNLTEVTEILDFKIKTELIYIKKVAVKGCIGQIKLKINSKSEFLEFINKLFMFAEYSGIGAKTSMGLGAVEIK